MPDTTIPEERTVVLAEDGEPLQLHLAEPIPLSELERLGGSSRNDARPRAAYRIGPTGPQATIRVDF